MKYIAILLLVVLVSCKSNSIEPSQNINSAREHSDANTVHDAMDEN